MQNVTRRNLLGLLRLAPAVPLAGHLLATPALAAETDSSARALLQRRNFPNVKLQDQDGKNVRFYDDLIKDKIVTINFFYAKCERLCPLVTSNLVRVQRLLEPRMGRDVFINSFTLKPKHDTPAVLQEFAREHGIQRGWNLLTGRPEDLELLRRNLGFTNLDPRLDQDKSQHIGNVRYGSEPLMQWTALPGMTSPESIAKAISRDFPQMA